jgi:hypothetical protein
MVQVVGACLADCGDGSVFSFLVLGCVLDSGYQINRSWQLNDILNASRKFSDLVVCEDVA